MGKLGYEKSDCSGNSGTYLACFAFYAFSANRRAKRAEEEAHEAHWTIATFLPLDSMHAHLRFINNSDDQIIEHVWMSPDQFDNPNGIAITALPNSYLLPPKHSVDLVIADRRKILELPDVLQISWTLPQSTNRLAIHRLRHLWSSPYFVEGVHYENLLTAQAKRDILDMMENPPVEHIPEDGGLKK